MAKPPVNKTMLSRIAGRFAGRYIRFVKKSSSIVTSPADPEALLRQEYPYILAMWHGQFMLLAPFSPRDLPISNMVARHGDAEIIGEALKTFDMGLVRGGGAAGRKRDRGGATAFREALRLLEDGHAIAMTADVPPGPARVAGMGIVKLAAQSGRPIIPVATASSRFWALDTWSRMTINLPFSRICAAHGDAIRVAADADDEGLELARQNVQTALDEVTARAYELAGADLEKATPDMARPPDAPPQKPDFRLNIYRAATWLVSPAMPLMLRYREKRGKEVAARRGERLGRASAARPAGDLVWLHAASVGETNAVLPLIERLRSRQPTLRFLLTTGTVTSASLAADRLQNGDIHQFAPLDTPQIVDRFLKHWQPALAILTESEIWPNMILACDARNVPVALINARMSNRSFSRWRRSRNLSRPIFNRIRVILAQNEKLMRRFRELGGRDTRTVGNLKVDAPALPVDKAALERLSTDIAGRPILLGASTHPGEDDTLVAAFQELRKEFPELLLILAPRHPERGPQLRDDISSEKTSVSLRSGGQEIGKETAVYIADTVGEMGLFYSLATIALIGGSLIERGGQNPIEAIRFDTAVLTGPSQYNFADAYRELLKREGAIVVSSADDIVREVSQLLRNPARYADIRDRARLALQAMEGALDETVDAIIELLPSNGEDLLRAS